jgi:DNA-binding HxlR family transcriptional regulator
MFDALSKSAICSSRIVITRSPGRTRVRLERAAGNVRLATVSSRLYRCARWTLLIIRDAFYGVRRFNDFQAHLDIPKAVLSARLSALVDNGLLRRRPDPDHAGRHLYELTDTGRDLWPALYALQVWGGRHRHPNSRVFKHTACNTTLDDSGYCATCAMTPAPEDILTKPRRGRDTLRDDAVARALRTPRRVLEPVAT